MATRGRTDISIGRKKEICEYKDKNPSATQGDIAVIFQKIWGISIARRTVGDILKRKADWESTEGGNWKRERHSLMMIYYH